MHRKKTGKEYRKISVVVSRHKYYEWFWFSFYILWLLKLSTFGKYNT